MTLIKKTRIFFVILLISCHQFKHEASIEKMNKAGLTNKYSGDSGYIKKNGIKKTMTIKSLEETEQKGYAVDKLQCWFIK